MYEVSSFTCRGHFENKLKVCLTDEFNLIDLIDLI